MAASDVAAPVEGAAPTATTATTTAGGCERNPWCVRGKGHRGFCSRRTPEEVRAHPLGGAARDRARAAARKSHHRQPASAAPSSPPTRARRPRSALQPLLGMAWSGIGRALVAYGPAELVPAGRVMDFEGPYAAARLHPLLLKVPAYKRMDQATGGLLDDVGPLVLAPVLAVVIGQRPESVPMLWPLLAAQLEPMAVEMARQLRESRDAARQVDELTAEVAELMEGMAATLFAPREPGEASGGGGHADRPAEAFAS